MSKVFKKLTGSRTALSVKLDVVEVMGSAVAEKDMFCVHWSMKGLRGRENTGETGNVRAAVSEGATYAVAKFDDVFAGEVHPKARKDGSGYDPMELEIRVVSPALHKKDDKIIGKVIVNIFDKVPVLASGQPAHHGDQTVPLTKDGAAVAHIKLTLGVKGDAPAEEPEAAEPEQPTTPTSPSAAEPPVIKTPPVSPQKEAGSEAGSTATSEVKEETESRKSHHRKRRSSNSSAMLAAQLKRKDEELKEKDEVIKQKDEDLKKKDEELKQKDEQAAEKQKENDSKLEAANGELTELRDRVTFLESRVKELEQANEKTDVLPIDSAQERMQRDIARLVEEKEALEDQRMQLADHLTAARKEIEELKSQSGDNDLEVMRQQLNDLKQELAKAKKEGGESAAPANNGMMMQIIFAAGGAVLGIIIGLFI